MRGLGFLFNLFLVCMSFDPFGSLKAYAHEKQCVALVSDSILRLQCSLSVSNSGDTLCNFHVSLKDDFKGTLWLNESKISQNNLKSIINYSDSVLELDPSLEKDRRSCIFVSPIPLYKMSCGTFTIPEEFFEIRPDYVEVNDIDLDETDLSCFNVAGAWHKNGSKQESPAMFSIIDDDSCDGQIRSSKPARYTYGYYSLLYPLLESLGLKGNLAAVGRNMGINETPYDLSDNGKTLLRFQNEKGWDILSHSMDCIGETVNNWMVDSLTSPLATKIFNEGPNKGQNANTVSVYDLQTRKQYWPNADNTDWEETPLRYIKPYVADYDTHKELMYNPDFNIDWHWGEWKRRAEEFGINAVGFVTHNSTSSHSLVPCIMTVFPYGLSDVGTININTSPMLSSGVRAGLEGQSLGNYDGNSTDNTFNEKHFKAFCGQIDETLELGGWIIFNLHAYRDCWLNKLPGKLVSEGGTYPDEWVIPMKGMDSANDSFAPPAHLGISDWSEWYPCPGTRLEMMGEVLKYAKKKGLKNVTCSEGFRIMGNKKSYGYFNKGHRFGKDYFGMNDTKDIYPHYVVSATDEVYYYNPLLSSQICVDINHIDSGEMISSDNIGKFLFSNGNIYWSSCNPARITLKLFDLTGTEIQSVASNKICLANLCKGAYILCALDSNEIIGAIKVIK